MVDLHLPQQLEVVAGKHQRQVDKERGQKIIVVDDVGHEGHFQDAGLVVGFVFPVKGAAEHVSEGQVREHTPPEQVGEGH